MALTLDQLQAERTRLAAEEEALQKEFGSGRGGREFLTGEKLADWEKRSLANDKALRNVNYQIRIANESEAARSNTAADTQSNNTRTDGTGTNSGANPAAEQLSDREKYALANRSVPSNDVSGDVVQGGTTVKNSGPFSNAGAFSRQDTAPNSGGSPVFNSSTPAGPAMSNGQLPGRSAEPVLTYAETQKSVVAKLSQQSVGSTTKKDANAPAGTGIDEKLAKQEKEIYNVTYNILNNYATHSYGFTLHVLTKDSYNSLARGEKGTNWLKDAYTLMSSGGRWGDRDKNNSGAFVRPPEFKDDFYIDEMAIKTVMGMSSETRGSNAVYFSFNIIEPYGLTLINRLLMLSKRIDQPNYTENPYVLQLDFFGNTDGGDVLNPIPKITKYLPIMIQTMSITVGTGGTTYACTATAYNHSAFDQSIASTPADFEISAKTVGDFFASGKDDANFRKQLAQRQAQQQRIDAITKRADERKDKKLTPEEEKQIKDLNAAYATAIATKSYTQAYNLHQLYLKDLDTIQHPTEIRFEIDADIAKSEIVYSEKTSVSNTPMSNVKDAKQAKAAASAKSPKRNNTTPAAGPDTNFQKFNVKAGEGLLEIINKVIRTSKYMTSQIKTNQNKDDKEQKQVDLFKVVPSVELIDFDYKLNKWSKRITFKIIKSQAHNHKHPDMAIADAETVLKDIRKKYDYIYTGENLDVIDLEIKFDALFHTQVEVLQPKPALSNSQDSAANSKTAANDKKSKGKKLPVQQAGSVQPNKITPIVANQKNMSFHSQQNEIVKSAADVLNSLYTTAGGDMVTLNLKIIGDPDFIKQDDIFYTPNTENHPGPAAIYSDNGSIMTDRGEIYCYVRFRTPVDIDLDTGGIRKLEGDQKYLDSSFTGVYRVVTVDSEFRGGKFEQALTLNRIPNEIVQTQVEASIKERAERNSTNTTASQKQFALVTSNVSIVSGESVTPREETHASYSDTQKAVVARVTGARQEELAQSAGSQNSDPTKQGRLAAVSAQGSTLTPDQQARQVAFSKDGTDPRISEPTTITSPPLVNRSPSSDPDIAKLQQDYNTAINNESAATARLKNVENGFYDSDPSVKAKVIETNNNLLRQALLAKSDISKALAIKGATPV